MSNRKRLPRPEPGRYEWLNAVRADLGTTDNELMIAEAVAYAADANGQFTEEDITRALGVLGYLDEDDPDAP